MFFELLKCCKQDFTNIFIIYALLEVLRKVLKKITYIARQLSWHNPLRFLDDHPEDAQRWFAISNGAVSVNLIYHKTISFKVAGQVFWNDARHNYLVWIYHCVEQGFLDESLDQVFHDWNIGHLDKYAYNINQQYNVLPKNLVRKDAKTKLVDTVKNSFTSLRPWL